MEPYLNNISSKVNKQILTIKTQTTMKRLFFVATLAIMAAGCQKTFVQDEVQTPIGFSTEVGKQTRAIVDEYSVDQPFAVFSYGYDNGVANQNRVMDHVEVGEVSTGVWKAKDGFTYYWPNDPDNYLNFYAYSPSNGVTAVDTKKEHQKLHFDTTVQTYGVTHDETNGLTITGYDHSNMYVDFMVADPVLKATYVDKNGDGEEEGNPATSTVPANFHHEMTQINFVVKIADQASYPGVDFTFKSIVFNNVYKKANYTNTSLNKESNGFVTGTWDTSISTPSEFTIFPVKKYHATTAPDGAPGIADDEAVVVLHTDTRVDNPATPEDESSSAKTSFSTTPVTMIPQTLVASNPSAVPAVEGQSFTIEYEIAGKGVASETISKTFDFYDNNATAQWLPNKKITYTLTISLKEITFTPSVTAWDPTTGSYDITND